MNWKKPGWGLLAGMLCTHAMAVEPWAPTDAELASLPPLCKVKMKAGAGSPEYKTWEQSMGKDWLHTHHYCAGLNFLNRYYRARSASDKGSNLKNAQGNLQYMVTHAAPTYSLMPDVYLNLGVVYSLSNQPAQAITHFSKAIELNPRQPRAYNAMADYYSSIKQTARALETVSEGLRHNPDTRSLQRRYTELGGKLPYPAPIEPEQVAAPATPPTEKTAAPVVQAPVEQAVTTPVPAAESSPPGIGSPKNPYCRFCPD
jgi:tetratricopeptide (TPR) repeat protein